MTEEEFRKLAVEKVYGEVEFQEIGPGPAEEMHAHEHSVLSLVLSGEFTMTMGKWTKVFKAGDLCENPAGTMHKEQTGAEGGSFLFAKKFS
jgi:mannose-6-phosphate isomerase-like protein (cupin superfamily)